MNGKKILYKFIYNKKGKKYGNVNRKIYNEQVY